MLLEMWLSHVSFFIGLQFIFSNLIILKFTKDITEMEGLCLKVLKQIDDKRYFEYQLNQDILLYGICFL